MGAERGADHRSAWSDHLESWLLPTTGKRPAVEWLPLDAERLRISLPVGRSLSDVERVLHVAPEELIRVAYGESSDPTPVVVPLQLSPRIRWLRMPVQVESWTTSTEHGGGVTLRWRATRLRQLLPEMEADLRVRPGRDAEAELVLDGRYRPPLGLAGLVADRLVGRFVAIATARDFLQRLGHAVEQGTF